MVRAISPDAPIPQPLERAVQRAETRVRVAARLKELMDHHAVSMRALAKMTGLARNTIIAALKGKNCHPSSLAKMFDTLEAPPQLLEELLKPRLSKEDLEIALAYHEAMTDVRNIVARILKTREFKNTDLATATMAMAYQFERCTKREQMTIQLLIDSYLKWPDDDDAQITPFNDGPA